MRHTGRMATQSELFGNPQPALPQGLVYQPAFLDAKEEAALIRQIEALRLAPMRYQNYTALRRVSRKRPTCSSWCSRRAPSTCCAVRPAGTGSTAWRRRARCATRSRCARRGAEQDQRSPAAMAIRRRSRCASSSAPAFSAASARAPSQASTARRQPCPAAVSLASSSTCGSARPVRSSTAAATRRDSGSSMPLSAPAPAPLPDPMAR
jgi:hypothetical protein